MSLARPQAAQAGVDARASAPPEASTARALYWALIRIDLVATLIATLLTLGLGMIGLDFTFRQWIIFWLATPFGVATFMTIDMTVFNSHFKPLRPVLEALQRGERPPDRVLGGALVRALNLPLFNLVRITLIHGPNATLTLCGGIYVLNTFFGAGVAPWQIIALAVLILFFAAPAHAIFEYFSINRAIRPTAERLSRILDGPIPALEQDELVAVPMRSKLIYLTVFVGSLPLVFTAASFLFKINQLIARHGYFLTGAETRSLYVWIIGVVIACIVGSVSMAILIAREVSRSAARLVQAMARVEQGRLEEARIEVVTTDEYADLTRGFSRMLASLREEQQILELPQDVAGELQLEPRIGRSLAATTQLLGADRASLFVHDAKTDELFTVYADGMAMRQIRLSSSSGIAGAVFTSGRMENITDPYADPRFNRDIDHGTGFVTRNVLCAPMTNKAGVRIGVVQALNKRAGDFTVMDETRLKAFAAQAAISLENARLFDDVLQMKNYNESILQSTSNGIVTLDAEGRIATANAAAEALLGLAGDALIGRASEALFCGPNRWVSDSLARTWATGEAALDVDAELARAAGSSATVNLTATPLIDATGARIGSVLVLEDITEEKRVRSTMSRYMSKEVADQVLSAGEMELGGKEQKVTVMFTDVRRFTSISEALGPRGTVSLLNAYFTEMVDVIFKHGGILDKYMGDGIMALYGAPLAGARDADNAVAAADDMIRRLAELNARRAANGEAPLDIGVGLSTGQTVIGNIGSVRRMEYTVIGDTVNLASRLEGASKQYGARIIISEMTARELRGKPLLRELDLIRVKGKDRAVAIYESLGYRQDEPGLAEMLERHAEGLAAYRARDWRKAEIAFAGALELYPQDGPANLYLSRCQRLAVQPPAADWDGVWNLTEK